MDILKRNNVNVIGQGQHTMMFAHGFGCDQNMWRYITPAFENKYRIVLFDYVGAGKSDLSAYSSSRYRTLDGYADDILDICKALKLEKVILVGHSVSSMIALLAAIKEPSYFERLVFIGPSPRYLNDKDYKGGFEKADIESLLDAMDSNYLGWSKNIAPAIMGNAGRPYLGEELANSFCATDPEIAREFARVTFLSDNRHDLPKLKTKTLSLQCTDDIIAPMEVGYYMDKNIEDHRLILLNAAGHCPHISEPQETIQAIKEFLAN